MLWLFRVYEGRMNIFGLDQDKQTFVLRQVTTQYNISSRIDIQTQNNTQGPRRGRDWALPLFCLGLFLGLQMTWIFYECYHLKATIPVYSCICTKSKALQSCAATVSFSSWDATRAAKCLEAMLKIWCFDDIRSVVTKVSEPEAKLVYEVQTISWLIAVNPATNAAGERSFSSARPLRRGLHPGWTTKGLAAFAFPGSRSLGRKARM